MVILMRMNDIIEKKKEGKPLNRSEIHYFVNGYTNDIIPDYQASALAMAIWFNKMNKEETAILTDEMAKSGDMLDLSSLGNSTVDKHSSGGIGDKTTLVVAPIVAAAGCVVAKMSGKGLGFTGGTIDKLESIPNFNTSMSPKDFIKQAKEISIVVAGQTGNMAPCDKKLYALRDVTSTVDCMPLIASSIMSKKLASGAKNIVLDVKCGSGAFMKTVTDATELAKQMVHIGKACGRKVSAFITDMDTPLGFAIGNSLEVKEAVDVLKGKDIPDLRELCLNLSAEMIALSLEKSKADSMNIAKDMLDSGKAYKKFLQMVEAQGGDVRCVEDTSLLLKDTFSREIKAERDGYLYSLNALSLGKVSVLLGAGRNVKTDKIDYSAGILLSKKQGDKISKNDTIMTLYSSDKEKLNEAEKAVLLSFEIKDVAPKKQPLILNYIDD